MTTPRDAIAGLSERLRQIEIAELAVASVMYMRPEDTANFAYAETAKEAATAIDALQARVQELEGQLAVADATLLRLNSGKELQDLMRLNNDLEPRALRAEQECDEAYERAAKVADKKADDLLDAAARLQGYIGATKLAYTEADLHEQAGTAIKALVDDIRRLAGPEKEKE